MPESWRAQATQPAPVLSLLEVLQPRRVFSVMCFRRSVQLRGRSLVGKGLRLPSCCRAVWLVCGFWLSVFCLCALLVSCFHANLISILLKIPAVDRPCLALDRQCRKKKEKKPSCCQAVKMRMTGSISCCRKRTYGPPLSHREGLRTGL